MYCNATQNQFYGDSAVNYNTNVFAVQNPGTTDNAINCCLRCAFSGSCNIWCVLCQNPCITSVSADVMKESPYRTTIFHGMAKGCASCLPPRNTESPVMEGTVQRVALPCTAPVVRSETCAVGIQDVVQCLGRVRQGLRPEGRRGRAVPAVHHKERRTLGIRLRQHPALHQWLPGPPLGAAPATLTPREKCSMMSAASVGCPTPHGLPLSRAARERS